MLTEEQILQIREHLEKAQNPVFFYDNENRKFSNHKKTEGEDAD
jgi:hypothetical protein